MKEAQTYILIQDIWSCFGKNDKERVPYGKKGERVAHIADHDNVLIVQGKKQRFTVTKKEIQE